MDDGRLITLVYIFVFAYVCILNDMIAMIENISESTIVTLARKGSSSLRTTIPEILVKLFNIEEGDKLTWSVNKDSKIMIGVRKHEHDGDTNEHA